MIISFIQVEVLLLLAILWGDHGGLGGALRHKRYYHHYYYNVSVLDSGRLRKQQQIAGRQNLDGNNREKQVLKLQQHQL